MKNKLSKDFCDDVRELAVDYWKWLDTIQFGALSSYEKMMYEIAVLNFYSYVKMGTKRENKVDTVSNG